MEHTTELDNAATTTTVKCLTAAGKFVVMQPIDEDTPCYERDELEVHVVDQCAETSWHGTTSADDLPDYLEAGIYLDED